MLVFITRCQDKAVLGQESAQERERLLSHLFGDISYYYLIVPINLQMRLLILGNSITSNLNVTGLLLKLFQDLIGRVPRIIC